MKLKTAPTVAVRNRCAMTFVRAKLANVVRGSAADDAVHAVRADAIESAASAVAIDVERCVRMLLTLPIHRFGVVKVDYDGDCMSAHVELASRRPTVAIRRTYISELASEYEISWLVFACLCMFRSMAIFSPALNYYTVRLLHWLAC